MTSTVQMSADASSLLRTAAIWRLVSLLLECPAPGWVDQVSMLASEAGDPLLSMAAEAARQQATPALYHSTFGPGGPAAPREVSYRRGVLPGASLAELRGFYAAFAYQPSVDEPPDHVAVEAGFVAYLCFKQAYALAGGNAAQSQACADATRCFLAEHLSRMAVPLAASLASSGITYLARTAEVLRSHAGPAPEDTSLPIVSSDELDGGEDE